MRRRPLRPVWIAVAVGLAWTAACTQDPAEQAAARRARGDAFLEAGRLGEASIEYQAALQHSPDDPEALYGLARCLEEGGRPGEYRKALERVLEASPGHVGASVDLGRLYWAGGAYARALELAERAGGGGVPTPEILRLKARALTGLGRVDEARRAWDELFAAGGDDPAYYVEAASLEVMAGGPEAGAQVLRRGLERRPESWRLWLARADLDSLAGRHEQAQEALGMAGSLAPEEPRVFAAAARSRVRRGDVAGALQELETVHRAMAPGSETSRRMARERAALLVELGAIEDARDVLEAERRSAPADPELSGELAYLALLQGRPDEAKALLPTARRSRRARRTVRQLEAWLHLLEGRPHWAEASLRGLIAQGDLTVETHLLYARALLDLDRLAPARRELEAIVRRFPGHFFARLDLAQVLQRQREPELALRVLDGLAPALRETAPVQFLRARLLLAQGDVEDARTLARGFLKKAPDNPALLVLMGDVERARGRPESALAWYRKAQEKAPAAREPLMARLAVLEEGGRVREAKRLLEEHIAAHGETPALLNRLASLKRAAGEPDAALQSVERSILLEPNHWASRYLRARLLVEQGAAAQAVVDLQEAINLHPLRPEPYNLLARIYWDSGDLARAEDAYRRLLEHKPGDPLTANNLAYLCLEQGRTEEALALARLAYEGAPRSPVVLDTLGWVLQQAGEAQAAAEFLGRAARGAPDDPRILLHWGANLGALGKRAEARKALSRVVRLAPDSEAAAEARAVLADLGP